MSKIKVITDSTSDIPPALAKELDIDVVPLNIFFGEEKFKDGVNIAAEDVYKRIMTQKNPWPTTSQPTAKEFLDYYNKAYDNGYETIISVHITANMSGTLNSVNLAKKMIPDKDLIIVDSNTVTHPLGLLACEIARLVQSGKKIDEIKKLIDTKYNNKANICGIVDTLEFLHRGGRIGRAQKVLGTLLKMKPILEVTEGSVNSFGKVKGHEEAFSNMVKMVPKIFNNLMSDAVWLGYAENKEYTMKLYDAIKDLPNAPKVLEVHEIGPTVGVHMGPGAMTISWLGEWNNQWYFEK